MTFPVVETETVSEQGSAGTSHPVSLPSGIVAGNLILVFFQIDTSSGSTVTFPAGWTKFVEDQHASAGSRLICAWRKATGGETGVTVTSSTSERSAHCSYRIRDADDPDTQPPEANSVDGVNSPSLTPTGGAKDYLWFTVIGANGNVVLTNPGGGYGNQSAESRTTNNSIAAARRELNASSDDPGSWSSGASFNVVATVAVHPTSEPTVALSGTVTDDTEADIRSGGSTIILTLTDGTWAASGASFEAQRQGIIDGLDSDGNESRGWDAVVRPAIPVGNVVRTSDTVVTITLPAVPSYFIEDQETITATVPASAVQEATEDLVAPETFTITNASTGDFPQVEAVAQSTQLDGEDRTLDLPSGIQAGNLLLLMLWIGNGSSVVDDPTGWTSIQNEVSSPNSGIIHRRRVFYRQADGTEGSTLALHISSGSTTVDTRSFVFRITDHRDPSIHPPEAGAVNENPEGQQTANPDPPSLSPSGGAKDYLWFAWATWGNSSSSETDVSSYPSNYTNGIQEGPAGGPADGHIGVARRELFAASEDAGAFTLGTSVDWLAGTVVVHPNFSIPGVFWRPPAQSFVLVGD